MDRTVDGSTGARPDLPLMVRGTADEQCGGPYRSIDADQLHGRLLKAIHVAGSTDSGQALLHDLLSAVDEAMDLGWSEREVIAWAAAEFWRGIAEDS